MYEIHRKDATKNDYILIAKVHDLKQARAHRQVGGDLVVDETNKIVTNPNWLFDWERKDENCYAQRAIRAEASLNEKNDSH